jgi:hypothetical protein
MDTKKMLDELEDCVFGYIVVVMLILFGALTFFDSMEANIMVMVGIFCLLIALIGFKIFETKCYAKIKANEDMSMQDKARREDIEDLISMYFRKHELAKELGGEYICQNDKAQVDAIQLVSDICDLYAEE